MAEPKRQKKASKEPAPVKTIGIKASLAWAEWVEQLAEHQRTTIASVIDRALAEHAESVGFKAAPPKRMP